MSNEKACKKKNIKIDFMVRLLKDEFVLKEVTRHFVTYITTYQFKSGSGNCFHSTI